MNAQGLYDTLRPLQEAKGRFFNPDMAMTLDLLGNLLVNKERYGYMACPCRLAAGEKEKDAGEASFPCGRSRRLPAAASMY